MRRASGKWRRRCGLRLAGYFELGVTRMQAAQAFFDFDFLSAGVVLQSFNALLFRFDVTREIGVFLFERADLAMLFGKRA